VAGIDRHLEDEALDFSQDSRSPRNALRAPIVSVRDQFPIPAKQRFGGDNGRYLAETTPTDRLRPPSESAALGVGEAKALSTELLS